MSRSILLIIAISLFTMASASAAELRDFTSDGCSLFPDGNFKDRALWCDCCLAHDMSYWRGGTEEDRKHADEMLRNCVLGRTGSKALADLMYDGVRTGGHPAFPTWYRWGYGWKYGKSYAPLTKQENQQVQHKLKAYYAKHPTGYCRERHEEVLPRNYRWNDFAFAYDWKTCAYIDSVFQYAGRYFKNREPID